MRQTRRYAELFTLMGVTTCVLIGLGNGCGFMGIDFPLEYHTASPDDGADPNAGDPNDDPNAPDVDPNGVEPNSPSDSPGDDPNGAAAEPNEPVIPETTHRAMFEQIFDLTYTDGACFRCHKDAVDFLGSAHWKWEGTVDGIAGLEGETHGKKDLINNFYIGVPSNEGSCAQCHTGFGWTDDTFDFSDKNKIDCLVCHESSGQYFKDTDGGWPTPETNLDWAAWSVGLPTRAGCGNCHFYAGGADNAKHGDLSTVLIEPTFETDVHMGLDGPNLTCQSCHHGSGHRMAGVTQLHSNEGEVSCRGCHVSTPLHNRDVLNRHLARVACQSCHIPRIARHVPTLVGWFWDEAGEDRTDIPLQEGRETYAKDKGRLEWRKDIRPELRWFNGRWDRMVVGVNDQYTSTPVVLANPLGDINDPDAKLYPFKRMVGRQPADKNNHTMLVPHLFGSSAGDHAYAESFDWDLALTEGAARSGQQYTGQFEFVDTMMFLSVNHQVTPQRQARDCTDCHGGVVDFESLGYDQDPWLGG